MTYYDGYNFNRRSFRKTHLPQIVSRFFTSSAQESAVSSRLLEDAIAKKKQKNPPQALKKSKLKKQLRHVTVLDFLICRSLETYGGSIQFILVCMSQIGFVFPKFLFENKISAPKPLSELTNFVMNSWQLLGPGPKEPLCFEGGNVLFDSVYSALCKVLIQTW